MLFKKVLRMRKPMWWNGHALRPCRKLVKEQLAKLPRATE